MHIYDYNLIHAVFNLNASPTADLKISQELKTEEPEKNAEKTMVMQSIIFTITENEKLIAVIGLKYLVALINYEAAIQKELETFIFERMQHVYIDKANDLLVPAHLPAVHRRNFPQSGSHVEE